ncbi:MAG: DUF4143 domain-containing protein [Gemmatimonadetes bacterium]|jgi:uncharacterized protein|nr:DUF4143 domain-containing protein [Gemmatimonadota bacterium]
MINLRRLADFENFMRLLAGRIGQLVNLSSLANDVGVSSTTLKEWLSVLEASYVVFRLTPYFENLGKRVVKSPKIYFTDVGLASYLLGIESPTVAGRDPLIGSLFENMVVLEALKARLNAGREPHLYFYRDRQSCEVDLLFQEERRLVPIEIKSAMTFHSDFVRSIERFQQMTSSAARGYVIYAGDLTPKLANADVLHFADTATLFS